MNNVQRVVRASPARRSRASGGRRPPAAAARRSPLRRTAREARERCRRRKDRPRGRSRTAGRAGLREGSDGSSSSPAANEIMSRRASGVTHWMMRVDSADPARLDGRVARATPRRSVRPRSTKPRLVMTAASPDVASSAPLRRAPIRYGERQERPYPRLVEEARRHTYRSPYVAQGDRDPAGVDFELLSRAIAGRTTDGRYLSLGTMMAAGRLTLRPDVLQSA